MTAFLTRTRVLLSAALAVVAAGSSFAVVHFMHDDSPTQRIAADRVASTTTTTIEPTTTSTTFAPTTTTTAAPATATAWPKAPTTTIWPPRGIHELPPLVTGCTWSARIVSGGLGSGRYVYDQFIVDMTNPAWADKQGYLKTTITKPATTAVPFTTASEIPDTTGIQPFDDNGHMQIIFPVAPAMQGGVYSIAPTASEEHNNWLASVARCDSHVFTLDYNGAEGLPGGPSASGASPFQAPLAGR